MSIFPIPVELLPDAKKLEEMNKELSAFMPKEFAGAVNLMVHPMAGVAAFSSLGLGVASHAFGVWMGAVAGAAEVSQRLFAIPGRSRDERRGFCRASRQIADRAANQGENHGAEDKARAWRGKARRLPRDSTAQEVRPPKRWRTPGGAIVEAELMPEDFHRPRRWRSRKSPTI